MSATQLRFWLTRDDDNWKDCALWATVKPPVMMSGRFFHDHDLKAKVLQLYRESEVDIKPGQCVELVPAGTKEDGK
jgi:hypothetical protein